MNQVSIADADFDMNAHLEMHRRALEQQRAEERDALRAERHHDVLCRVIDKLLEAQLRHNTTNGDLLNKLVGVHMEIALAYADLAYPPPKAEGT